MSEIHSPAVIAGADVEPEITPRVLLVDDDAFVRRAYGRVLRSRGFDVTTVDSGAAAVATLQDADISVIVSDVHMPDMNGIELLAKIREHDVDLPVILITGAPTVATAMKAVDHGALRYLVKPVESDDLASAVARGAKLHQMAVLKRDAAVELGWGEQLAGDRSGIEAAFKRAIDSLTIAYQPIVNWNERRVIGYEGLVRVSEPSIPDPGVLLTTAERLGQLPLLGRTIRANIAATLAECAPDHDSYVNVHPSDLLDDDLLDPAAPLSRHAGRVVLEITERASLDGVGDVPDRIRRLRHLGFRVAIDDLGAGYAGLSYFARLSPDVVKIDMSLIRHIDHSPTQQRLVKSLVAVSRELGLEVIAEGIETAAERAALTDLGCDLMQGYLFAKPGPPFPAVQW